MVRELQVVWVGGGGRGVGLGDALLCEYEHDVLKLFLLVSLGAVAG